jgi:hypothetical protein
VPAVFEAMLDGWVRQQRVRFLKADTIQGRVDLVRRLAVFSNQCRAAVRTVALKGLATSVAG